MAPGASFVFLLPACAAAVTALPFVAGVLDGRVPTGWSVDAAALIPALAVFVVVLPLASFLYTALGSVGWPVSTLLLCLATTELLPLIAAASRRVRQRAIMLAALLTVGGTLATVVLPTYSVSWPERINFEYWLDADTGTAHWLAQTDSSRLPAQIARAANFDPLPHPHFEGSSSPRFYAPAPARVLAAPELTQSAAPSPGSSPLRAAPAALPSSATATTHYELRLRSPRGAPGAVAVFPASAKVREITVLTAAGTSRYKLHRLEKGATLLEVVGLSPQGLQFGIDAADGKPLAVQIFDQSYDFDQGQFLQRARPIDAASSQDGDLTVVHRTVSLDPAPGR
jgi:hypothetical protein